MTEQPPARRWHVPSSCHRAHPSGCQGRAGSQAAGLHSRDSAARLPSRQEAQPAAPQEGRCQAPGRPAPNAAHLGVENQPPPLQGPCTWTNDLFQQPRRAGGARGRFGSAGPSPHNWPSLQMASTARGMLSTIKTSPTTDRGWEPPPNFLTWCTRSPSSTGRPCALRKAAGFFPGGAEEPPLEQGTTRGTPRSPTACKHQRVETCS